MINACHWKKDFLFVQSRSSPIEVVGRSSNSFVSVLEVVEPPIFFSFSVVTPSISSIEVDEKEAADTNRLSSSSSVEKWGMRGSSFKVPKNELDQYQCLAFGFGTTTFPSLCLHNLPFVTLLNGPA